MAVRQAQYKVAKKRREGNQKIRKRAWRWIRTCIVCFLEVYSNCQNYWTYMVVNHYDYVSTKFMKAVERVIHPTPDNWESFSFQETLSQQQQSFIRYPRQTITTLLRRYPTEVRGSSNKYMHKIPALWARTSERSVSRRGRNIHIWRSARTSPFWQKGEVFKRYWEFLGNLEHI